MQVVVDSGPQPSWQAVLQPFTVASDLAELQLKVQIMSQSLHQKGGKELCTIIRKEVRPQICGDGRLKALTGQHMRHGHTHLNFDIRVSQHLGLPFPPISP